MNGGPAGKLDKEELEELLQNLAMAAPEAEAPHVELLCRWARRGQAISTTLQVLSAALQLFLLRFMWYISLACQVGL